jgi:tRNA (guanine-N7-)-methyltransferase
LIQLAIDNPNSNVIGIEISNRALDQAVLRVRKAGIENIRLVRARAYMFFWLVCANSSIRSVHINFPDPWPKAAHENRRLVSRRFLNLLAARLEPGGLIQLATDDSSYASAMSRRLLESPCFDDCEGRSARNPSLPTVQTKYEIKAINDGRECHYLVSCRNRSAVADAVRPIEELEMPHVIINSPMPLLEIGQRFEPAEFSTGSITVRFVDFFHSVRYDQAVVDTYAAEGELEQRVMVMIKRKSGDDFILTLRETGFPRPTPATHYAVLSLAEMIVSMHARAEIIRHNLKLELAVNGETGEQI